jgi:hypothetical protein
MMTFLTIFFIAIAGFVLLLVTYWCGGMTGGDERSTRLRIHDYRSDDSKIHYLIEHRDKTRRWHAIDIGIKET